MQTEFEIKFLQIDPDAIRDWLQSIWAICTIPLRRMQRYVFAHPYNPNAYIRIRKEWNKTTTSYKEDDGHKTLGSIKEIEIEIDNAEGMRNIYLLCWLREKAIQETYRETRIWNTITITIDRRPWLKPFIEIEWPQEIDVNNFLKVIWLDKNDWLYGTVSDVYHHELWIPLDMINEMPVITFDNPPLHYYKY